MSSGSMLSDSTKKVDETKLKEFMGKVVNDIGATWSTVLVIIGDKLGLYKAMADSKPVSAEELASRTRTSERYIREWLALKECHYVSKLKNISVKGSGCKVYSFLI
jgi:hypothetical protein